MVFIFQVLQELSKFELTQANAAKIVVLGGILAAFAPPLLSLALFLWELGKANPFLQTAIIGSTVGGISYTLKMSWNYIRRRIESYFTREVTIKSTDEHFDIILLYICQLCVGETTTFQGQTKKNRFATWEENWQQWKYGRRKAPELEYLPKGGNQDNYFMYKGHRVSVWRSTPREITSGRNHEITFLEELTLTLWGTDKSILEEILEAAMHDAYHSENVETTIYQSSGFWWAMWSKALKKKPRTKESVILDQDLATEIIADAQSFLDNAQWYRDTGIPYRRGYLFYGPPGCGKTSFVQVMAGELNLDICMLTLSNTELNDNKLARSLREAPARCIIMLEDVDAVFVERKSASGKSLGVSFSGLLNALDGVASQEGRMFVMTTNHLDRLDAALIRPGRCDVKIEIKKATHHQMKKMYSRFYPEHTEMKNTFAFSLPEYEISMAQLQGHLMLHREDPQAAIDTIPKFLESCKIGVKDCTKLDISIYDHLKRLNLHRWAWLFEFHGYHRTTDLGSLKADTVKSWCPHIAWESADFALLTSLLEDKELPDDYDICKHSYMREQFIRHYYRRQMDSRNSSSLFSLTKRDGCEDHNLEDMADSFCDKVCIERRSQISRYQMRVHLNRYPKPHLAVQNADLLVQPRSDFSLNWETTSHFLSRIGREDLLEKAAEFTLVKDLVAGFHSDLHKSRLQYEFGNEDYKLIGDLSKGTCDTSKSREYAYVRFADVRPLIRTVFPHKDEEECFSLADFLTDSEGRAEISVLQFLNVLKKSKAGGNRFDEIKNSIDQHGAVMEELVESEPKTQLYEFLKSHGLEQYYERFAYQEFTEFTRETPKIQANTLKGFGFTKIGVRWKLLRIFEEQQKAWEKEKELEEAKQKELEEAKKKEKELEEAKEREKDEVDVKESDEEKKLEQADDL